jgi:hypothetical protein
MGALSGLSNKSLDIRFLGLSLPSVLGLAESLETYLTPHLALLGYRLHQRKFFEPLYQNT